MEIATAAGAAAIGLAIGFVAGRCSKRTSGNARQTPAPQRERNGNRNRNERNGERTSGQNRRERGNDRHERDVRRIVEQQNIPREPFPEGSVELYVGNLSYSITDDSLNAAFARFGEIVHARVVINRYNGRSKGFGFVVMKNRPEAERAIAAMNEADLEGRKLRVNEAQNGTVGFRREDAAKDETAPSAQTSSADAPAPEEAPAEAPSAE